MNNYDFYKIYSILKNSKEFIENLRDNILENDYIMMSNKYDIYLNERV
jgi:hypothetical protein